MRRFRMAPVYSRLGASLRARMSALLAATPLKCETSPARSPYHVRRGLCRYPFGSPWLRKRAIIRSREYFEDSRNAVTQGYNHGAMPRYRTVASTICERGHFHSEDDRVLADSEDQAHAISLKNIAKRTCRMCGSGMATIRIVGTEPTTENPEYLVYGYTCHCGERVAVMRMELGISVTPPASRTVSCSKGHSRTVLNPDFFHLDKGMEKLN
jgi:hypothetical protein